MSHFNSRGKGHMKRQRQAGHGNQGWDYRTGTNFKVLDSFQVNIYCNTLKITLMKENNYLKISIFTNF
jgi:hypothetical protein